MRKIVLGSSCAAAVLSLTAVVGANQATSQTPTQSPVQSGTQGVGAPGTRSQEPATTPSTAARSAAQPNQMTLTGCVAQGPGGEFTLNTAAAGSSGAAGASGNISPGVGGSISAGASATGGTRAGMYRLSGQDFTKLVGQRVEIVGTVQPSTGSSSATASATSSPGATASTDRPSATASAPDRSSSTPSPVTPSTDPARAGDRASATDANRSPTEASPSASRPQAGAVGTTGSASATSVTMQNVTVSSVKELGGNCR